MDDDNGRSARNLDHKMHCNINERQEALRKDTNNPFEHWLYEAKRMMSELHRLPIMFKKEREGKLPTVFKYCSMSPTEQLPVENKLVCCLGQEVKTCQILADAFKGMDDISPEMIDSAKAHVCVGHILTESAKRFVDTSEGYISDETDRQYWQRTYASLAMADGEGF